MTLFVAGKLFREAGANSGGGGGNAHFLGWYETSIALSTAHPTAEDGDYAIVGSTDTIWVWDSDSTAWKDTDQKGQVTSVNNRTGAVTVSEVPDQTGYSGRVLGTDGFVAGWVVPEQVQRSVMPQADQDEEGNIYQFVGTTDANYTNGYVYKCVGTTTPSSATASQTAGSSLSDIAVVVATFETQITTSGSYIFTSDGSDWSYNGNVVDLTDYGITYTGTPVADDAITVVYTEASTTYAWTRIDVQPTPNELPSQTGQSGKYLTTDGTSVSWGTVGSLPSQTGNADKFLTTDGTDASWKYALGVDTGCTIDSRKPYLVLSSSASNIIGNAASIDSNGKAINGWVLSRINTSGGGFEFRLLDSYGYKQEGLSFQKDLGLRLSGTNSSRLCVTNIRRGSNGSDITVPTTGGTMAVINIPATAPELTVADWSSNTQTITVTGVTASNVVLVSPAPASAADYADAGIICTAQNTDSLTFTCDTVPTNAITLSVVIL